MRVLDKTEYNRIHKWNLRHWQKTGKCNHCRQNKTTQWANKTHNYIPKDRADWLELCVRCHAEYDKKFYKLLPKNEYLRELKEELRGSGIKIDSRYKVQQRLMTYAWY